MKRLRILVSRFGPSAPRDLCDKMADLGTLQSHLHKTKFLPSPGDVVVNWGCIAWPESWSKSCGANILNHPEKVKLSTNRIKSLPLLAAAGVNVPEMTTKFEEAKQWLTKGHGVIARAQNRSFGGHGLSYVAPESPDSLPPNSALYTKYQPKKSEYRVHVFGGKIIQVSEKRRRKGVECNSKIRSWENGWVFCQSNVNPPASVCEQALKAVAALGLDFGAVDVGYTANIDKAVVYECNTAPGLWPSSIEKYADAIRGYYNAVG